MAGSRKSKILREALFSIIVFTVVLWISAGIHHGKGYYNWQSEIWGDKAGYYIYLPATLYYHFDPGQYPPNIAERTGDGFYLDSNGKLQTKYTCGVALLVSPFFIATHYITKIFNIPQDWGFAPVYHRMTWFAALFYLVLGLWFLKRFLEHYLPEITVYFTLVFLVFGTNLLYFSTAEPLMSHVYSFFLFSAMLFFLKKFTSSGNRYIWFLLMSLCFALIVLVRPVNLVVLPFLLLWDVDSKESLRERIRMVFSLRYLIPFLLILFIIFLPQMIYWKYSSGSFLVYSYSGEGFTNLAHPYIFQYWFSTMNGLFLYTPIALFFIVGIVWMIIRKRTNGILLVVLFLFISYLFSSWSCWFYGCSFGQRSMIAYYSFLVLPFGFIIRHAVDHWKDFRYLLFWIILVGFSWYNVKFSTNFTGCFEGSVWDYTKFKKEIGKAGVYPPLRFAKGYNNDFENHALYKNYYVMDTISRSGNFCMLVNPDAVKYIVYTSPAWDFDTKVSKQTVEVSFWAYTNFDPSDTLIRALVTCSLDLGKVNLQSMTTDVTRQIGSAGRWYPVKESFEIPGNLNQFCDLNIRIRNHGTQNYFIDDLKVRFK